MKRFFLLTAVLFLALPQLAFPSFADETYDPPHEHSWRFVSHTDYTCDEDGYDLYVCDGCGEEERRITDPASHRDVVISKTEPSCESEGVEVRRCEVCGNETVITTPATGHRWDDGVIGYEPTFFKAGRIKYVCRNDPSHVRYEEIPPECVTDPAEAAKVYSVLAAVPLSLILAALRKKFIG
ncbi:MAG: hypothetical protein IJQ80_00515 [Clostridia bacterium]|nr:hypothetical protein [Clostridia bacterium]